MDLLMFSGITFLYLLLFETIEASTEVREENKRIPQLGVIIHYVAVTVLFIITK